MLLASLCPRLEDQTLLSGVEGNRHLCAAKNLMESPRFFQVSDKTAGFDLARNRPRYKFGSFELDIERHVLTREGLAVALPPKCFDLLCILVKNCGDLLEKDDLMRALWPDTFVEEANLSNLIALLRKVLGDSPDKAQYIKTVPKLGYRFIASLEIPLAAPETTHGPVVVQKPEPIRIIVFPFRPAAGFDDHENLGWSLPDAISSALAELNAFTVRSIQVAMGFDPTRWSPKTVAEEADVNAILTGTLGPGDSGIHAVIQLIQAPSGTLLWSRSWDVDSTELLQLHHGVMQLVVRSLLHKVAEVDTPARPAGPRGQSEAYNLYLMANQLCLQRSLDNMSLARDMYIASVEKDPEFAPAWARLGRCYRFLEKFGATGADNSAQKAFDRAFALNPDLVLAHCLYTPAEADWGHAEGAMVRLLRRVVTHQSSPDLFAALVHACRYCGQLDASVAAHHRALQLDPKAHTSVAHTYFLLGDYERSLFWYGTRGGVYLDALALARCRTRAWQVLRSTS